jgi:hypothetical protein
MAWRAGRAVHVPVRFRLPPEVEAAICELRRTHPRWGARRIEFELGLWGAITQPSL